MYIITTDIGVLALWKGSSLTVGREMALNMGMLASYDQSVEFFKDNLGFGASSVCGFLLSAYSLPFDYVKTQIQKMQSDAEGKYPYTGSLDFAMKTLKAGEPFKLYTGLLRQATYTTARLGRFMSILTNKELEANDGKPLPLYQKTLCGLTAGVIEACVGSPADLGLL
ncbi:hypothetical protein L2E82_22900 [Cichorium intybus]|uniref:Uncharacterized protein n=1 Tax=Cichorium intybus TaxID=13427 RepID=A0ACB9DYI2_CICIN|nr:hypothetical protein L2E82_22900 [Cichorium intybus]